METPDFDKAFGALTGNPPFPWQRALYLRLIADRPDNIPSSCNLPTGLGKTSVVAIWLLALARYPNKLPRRLVYIVNRRTVVDQTTNEVEKLRARLWSAGLFDPLRKLCAIPPGGDDDAPLAISTLRGQFADNREWSADPARPAVIAGTVDMIGSRLLFSGYGIGFKQKPLHAGFLGQDVLLVHDEAHLEPAFQELLMAIHYEQRRCREFGHFRVMALSATARGGGTPFELTHEEQRPPEVVADPPTTALEVVWRRLKAKKGIAFHQPESDKEKVAERIGKLADQYAASHPGSAVLVFVNSLEDHVTVRQALGAAFKDGRAQVLTGTLRGLERDRMADPRREDGCPIFARFLKPPGADADERERWKVEPRPGTVYLVCTSAGEVGIDISADHMVGDLTAFDRMAQRFGRVNRFGAGDANIDIVHEATADKKKEHDATDQARWKTLELLKELPQVGERRSASPLALVQLRQREDLMPRFDSAYTPPPTILPASDILFDSWALTTIWDKLPGRPPVEPYLHGIAERDPPQTYVAWREEVWELDPRGKLHSGPLFRDADERRDFERYARELLEDYPLKPHELLRDCTFRKNSGVQVTLARLAVGKEELPVWVQDLDGTVSVMTLADLADADKGDRLMNRTVILPPQAGGLSSGLLTSDPYDLARSDYDVADEWRDQNGKPRRVRVWDNQPVPEDMRLIRTIDTNPDADEAGNDEATGRRFWRWYELPKAGDGDGSKSTKKPVLWEVHRDDVVRNATDIVASLSLSAEMKRAVIVAAKFHDLGKRRTYFQKILGNFDGQPLLAKSGKGSGRVPEQYRHEFGSLLDVPSEAEFQQLSDDMKDLVLHLIAVHHGRGRPHFPADEVFDPEPQAKDVSAIAAEVPRRFAKLQRKYGRWGLAYLESLLRAADYAASAKPSAFVEDKQ
jgi:CRISPR-associated endonuclease/helicase Cas3